MRVIAGQYRGRRFRSVPKGIRPSSDRLRETLFSILGDAVEGSVWLDPFTGSGAIGIEALSRGARHVIMGDRSSESLNAARKNLRSCVGVQNYEIHRLDAFVLLRKLQSPSLDYVFLDPPYNFKRHEKILRALKASPSVNANTRLILEIFKKTEVKFVPEALTVFRLVSVGDSRLLFMRLAEPSKK